MDYTVDQVKSILVEAEQAAHGAAVKFFNERLNGQDRGACGFAWVTIFGVRGNTRLGKALKAAGVRQDYTKAFCLWNPAKVGVQNIDTLEAGAQAAAEVLVKYGFRAYADSRLD